MELGSAECDAQLVKTHQHTKGCYQYNIYWVSECHLVATRLTSLYVLVI